MNNRNPHKKGEVRDIAWHAVSAKEQAHQLCRYCMDYATRMRQQGKQGWVLVCDKHATYSNMPFNKNLPVPPKD